MRTYIVYIPGIGDVYDSFRKCSLWFWRIGGVSTQFVVMNWFDGQSMGEKIKRINTAIDLVPQHQNIVLIGESAGATLALHTAKQNQRIDKVITVCGVAKKHTPISTSLRNKAPALDQAVDSLPEKLIVPVHSVRAILDGVIAKDYSIAVRAKSHVVWSAGHLFTIILCLTIAAPLMIAIAKSHKS